MNFTSILQLSNSPAWQQPMPVTILHKWPVSVSQCRRPEISYHNKTFDPSSCRRVSLWLGGEDIPSHNSVRDRHRTSTLPCHRSRQRFTVMNFNYRNLTIVYYAHFLSHIRSHPEGSKIVFPVWVGCWRSRNSPKNDIVYRQRMVEE